jgi:hypothetical protein
MLCGEKNIVNHKYSVVAIEVAIGEIEELVMKIVNEIIEG